MLQACRTADKGFATIHPIPTKMPSEAVFMRARVQGLLHGRFSGRRYSRSSKAAGGKDL
jgi:hypothetical protein